MKKIGKKKKLIKELVARRDEVVSRAKKMSEGNIPDIVLASGRFIDIIFWVVEPHISPDYNVYNPMTNEMARETFDKTLNKYTEGKCNDKES